MKERLWLVAGMLTLLFLVVASQAQTPKLPRPSFGLQLTTSPSGESLLAWTPPVGTGPVKSLVLRSTTDLRATKDARTFPIAVLEAREGATSFRDRKAPHDVPLSYQVKLVGGDGRAVYSKVAFTTLRAPKIGPLERPSLYVDKSAYTLALIDGGKVLRRFPIALGADPVRRKLYFDRACTPEGFYQISGVQPKATFYKAYDINYPNEVDRIRYRVLADQRRLPNPQPGIGGEIQIHGQGIEENWTWGCIALRDSDMDLLFSLPELAEGTTVIVAGAEIGRADLQSDRDLDDLGRQACVEELVAMGLASGRSSKHWTLALCKYQLQQGLPVTGIFDRATRQKMGRDKP